MNTYLVEALRTYLDKLVNTGKATEGMYDQGFKWDDEMETWIDPGKAYQYPYDTIYDPQTPRQVSIDRYKGGKNVILPKGGKKWIKRMDAGMPDNERWALLRKETEKSQDKKIRNYIKKATKSHSRRGKDSIGTALPRPERNYIGVIDEGPTASELADMVDDISMEKLLNEQYADIYGGDTLPVGKAFEDVEQRAIKEKEDEKRKEKSKKGVRSRRGGGGASFGRGTTNKK